MTTIGLGQERLRCRDEEGCKPRAEKRMCRVGGKTQSSVQTFPVTLSRVFIWLLARDQRREYPKGSSVAMSHLELCYTFPCPNNSVVGKKVALVGSQLSLPFYSY